MASFRNSSHQKVQTLAKHTEQEAGPVSERVSLGKCPGKVFSGPAVSSSSFSVPPPSIYKQLRMADSDTVPTIELPAGYAVNTMFLTSPRLGWAFGDAAVFETFLSQYVTHHPLVVQ